MRLVVTHWIRYLETNEGVLGIILVVCGLCFLLAGWRFGRISLVLIYGLIGAALGCELGSGSFERILYTLLCGGGGAALGFLLRRYSAPLLAGALSSFTAWTILGQTMMPPSTIYILVGLTFIAVTAVSVMSKRGTTIVLTSLVGAIFLVAGLIAMVSESRTLGMHYRGMASHGLFFVFALLVPTVSGILLQLAAAKRTESGDLEP